MQFEIFDEIANNNNIDVLIFISPSLDIYSSAYLEDQIQYLFTFITDWSLSIKSENQVYIKCQRNRIIFPLAVL